MAKTVIHVNRASGPGDFPLRARTSHGDVLSHENFVIVGGAGEAEMMRGEDELVMQASSLSHTAAGLLALSPPAPVSAVDEGCCHTGRPCVPISC